MPSDIEWTDETWNPVVGCDRISPGCDHCYAIGVAHRALQPAHEGLTIRRPGEPADWSGVIRCLPERLEIPGRWRRPRRVFVNSMSDLFHPAVPAEFIIQVFDVMANADQHTFQVLTKRPQRMAAVLATHFATPVANVWLGVSIENDRYAWRADYLRRTPAAVRFLSLEPLLGPLPSLDLTGIDWAIVGGESGTGARPMHPSWPRDLRDRCGAAGVPFFYKQWGNWAPFDGLPPVQTHGKYRLMFSGTSHVEDERGVYMHNVGKRAAGRLLDGRTWDEIPAVTSTSSA
jgi:protein gp37